MASQHKISIVVEGKDNASGVFGDIKKSAGDLGKSLTDFGGKLTAGITAPLVGLGAVALAASTDLNAAMANVAALGVPIERVNELKTAVQDLAIETGKSTDDLAGGLYQVISAFGDTADSVEILRTNAVLAAAGLATTEEAINLTSAVTKAYDDVTAESVSHVADLALKTVELGQTTLPELAAAYGKVTSLGNALGVTQEELAATFATLTGVTGNTAEVSTQMAATYQALLKPSTDMATAIGVVAQGLDEQGKLAGGPLVESWRGYGQTLAEERDELGKMATRMNALTRAGKEGSKEFKDLSRRFKEQQKNVKDANKAYEQAAAALGPALVEAVGFGDAMGMISDFADGNTDKLIGMFGSVEAGRLALQLGGASADDYAIKLEAMGNVSGSLTKAFEAQTQGINAQGFSMQQLRTISQVLLQRLGDGLAPALGSVLKIVLPLADKALELATAFANADEKTQLWIVGALGIAAALGPALVAFGTLLPIVAALVSPIGLVAAGIAAIIALDVGGIRTKLVTAFDDAKAAFEGAGGGIKGVVAGIEAVTGFDLGPLITRLGEAKTAFEGAGGGADGLVAAIETLTGLDLSGVMAKMTLWGALAGAAFKSAKTALEELRDKITENIDIPAITDKIKLAFGAAVTFDLTTIDLGNLKDSVVTAISGIDWSTLHTGASTIFAGFVIAASVGIASVDWSTLRTGASTVFATLKSGVTNAITAIDWSDLAGQGVALFGTLKTGILSALGSVDWSLTEFARGGGTTGGLVSAITKMKDGVIDAILSVEWGTIAAEKLTLLQTSIGKLKDGVVDAIMSVEWGTIAAEKLGQLDTAITGLKDAAIDAILNISWAPSEEQLATLSGLLSGVGPVLEQIFGPDGILNTVSTSINQTIDAFSTRLSGVDGVALGKQFTDIVTGVTSFATLFLAANLEGISERVLSVVGLGNSILTFLTEFGQGIDAEAVSTAIGGFVSGIVTTLASKLADPEITNLGTNIGTFVSTIITKIGDALGGNLGETLGGAAGTAFSGLATAAMNIVTGIATELSKVDMKTFQTQLNTFVGGFLSGVATEISTGGHDWGPIVGAMMTAIVNALRNFTWNIGGEDVGEVEGRRFGSGMATEPAQPAWVTKLLDGEVTAPSWLQGMLDWTPTFVWPTFPTWTWPDIPALGGDWWPDIPSLAASWWPDIPSLTPTWWPSIPSLGSGWWPKIPTPDWVTNLISAINSLVSGGFDESSIYRNAVPPSKQAGGTAFWRGGLTWVGEEGPELVNLPRGSQVWPHNRSMDMAGEMGGGVVVNVYATVNNDIDREALAYAVAREVQRRRS